MIPLSVYVQHSSKIHYVGISDELLQMENEGLRRPSV